MISQAWAPGHATLFFSVPYQGDNSQERGSLGGGFNFASGVKTIVSSSDEDVVTWNGKKILGEVSLTVLKRYREVTSDIQPVRIDHTSDLGMGYGLSTSGAGALGASLALNNILRSPLTTIQSYQIAHHADVVNHTGLGSVVGQIASGIELRTVIGGPGIGTTIHIPSDRQIIILMHKGLKTSQILRSEKQMKQITKVGLEKVQSAKALKGRYVEEFLQLGREFTRDCGLETPKVSELLSKLEDIGEDQASMAMIGETIIVLPRDLELVKDFAKETQLRYIMTTISNQTPFVIS